MLIPELKNITGLTSGTNHIVALDTKGTAWAWGAADAYQLGRPDRASRTEHTCLEPMRIPGLERKKIVSVGCGDMHTMAVDDTGIAYGWGLNAAGECSIHPVIQTAKGIVERPKVIQGLGAHHIKQLVGGTHHTVAIASDGKVLVWGAVDSKQSGLDLASLPAGSCHSESVDSTGRPKYKYLMKPTVIPGLDASHVSAGGDTSAVITTDGKLYTWGYNSSYRKQIP
jgi:regulator of chromosome condensation